MSLAWAGLLYLGAVLDVVSFVEAQVAQVVGRGPLAGLARLRGESQVREVFGEGAEAVSNVVEGAVGRGTLVHTAAQRLRGTEALSAPESLDILFCSHDLKEISVGTHIHTHTREFIMILQLPKSWSLSPNPISSCVSMSKPFNHSGLSGRNWKT